MTGGDISRGWRYDWSEQETGRQHFRGSIKIEKSDFALANAIFICFFFCDQNKFNV